MSCIVQAHPGVERVAAGKGPSGGGWGQYGSRRPLQQRHAAAELSERPREEDGRPRRQDPGPHLHLRRPVPHSKPLQNHAVCLHAMVGNFQESRSISRTHSYSLVRTQIVWLYTQACAHEQPPFLIQNDSSFYYQPSFIRGTQHTARTVMHRSLTLFDNPPFSVILFT